MKAQAEALRRDGVDLVVVVMHADRQQGVELGEAHVADVILTGHNHDLFIQFDGRTLMVESAYDAHYVTVIDLHIETKQQGNRRDVEWWPQFRVIDTATVTPDPEIAAMVAGFQQELDREMDVPLDDHRGRARQPQRHRARPRGRDRQSHRRRDARADPRRRRDHERRRHPRRQGLRAGHSHHPPRRAGGAAVRQSSGGARRQGQRSPARARERPVAAARRRRAVSASVRHDGRVRPAAAGRQPRSRRSRSAARRSTTTRPTGSPSTISWRAAATAIAFAAIDPLVPLEDTPLVSDEVMIYLRGLDSVRTGVEGRMTAK